MRRRAIRDLGTISGIIVILTAVILVNGYMTRGSAADQFTKQRQKAEQSQKAMGMSLLPWDILRKTTGSKRSGPTFDEKLLEYKDQPTSLIGFMVPLEEFRDVTNFLLLPVPIECYFCQMPPMRDVVLVQMAKDAKTDIFTEPVLLNGTLMLNEGPGTKFFYMMKDATLAAAEKGSKKLNRRNIRPEAIQHSAQTKDATAGEQLIEGQKPPAAAQPTGS